MLWPATPSCGDGSGPVLPPGAICGSTHNEAVLASSPVRSSYRLLVSRRAFEDPDRSQLLDLLMLGNFDLVGTGPE